MKEKNWNKSALLNDSNVQIWLGKEGDQLFLHKILHLLFFLLLRILCALCLEIRKNNPQYFNVGPLEFHFLRMRRCLANIFRNPSHSFGVIGKTPCPISLNNFVNKFLSASAITITSCQYATRSFFCSEVKTCGRKRGHNILFP